MSYWVDPFISTHSFSEQAFPGTLRFQFVHCDLVVGLLFFLVSTCLFESLFKLKSCLLKCVNLCAHIVSIAGVMCFPGDPTLTCASGLDMDPCVKTTTTIMIVDSPGPPYQETRPQVVRQSLWELDRNAAGLQQAST